MQQTSFSEGLKMIALFLTQQLIGVMNREICLAKSFLDESADIDLFENNGTCEFNFFHIQELRSIFFLINLVSSPN
jgi:hypothetical protein